MRTERIARISLYVLLVVVIAAANIHFSEVAFAFDYQQPENTFKEWMEAGCDTIYKSASDLITGTAQPAILTSSLSSIISSGVYNRLIGISDGAVKPIAASIFCLCMLVRLLKASEHFDHNETLPGWKEILTLVIYAAILTFLGTNAPRIVEMIYNMFISIGRTSEFAPAAIPLEPGEYENADLPQMLLMLILGLFVWIVALIARVVAQLMVWARAIQLYLMAFIAPVPVALLGYEGTRQYGIGYLKNIASLGIAGLFMVIIFWLYPQMLTLVLAQPGLDGAFGGAISTIVYALVLVYSLIKSASVAREALGG